MKFKKYLAAAIATPLLVGAAACSPTHHAATTPQAKASVSALASVPGADAQAMLIRAGVPVNGTPAQQIAFGKSMLTKSGRDNLVKKLEIPQANKDAFEAAVLGAAEHDHLSTHAGRVTFFDTTLPNLVNQYQS